MRVTMDFLQQAFGGMTIPMEALEVANTPDENITTEAIERTLLVIARTHRDQRVGLGITIAKGMYEQFHGKPFNEIFSVADGGQFTLLWAHIMIELFNEIDNRMAAAVAEQQRQNELAMAAHTKAQAAIDDAAEETPTIN